MPGLVVGAVLTGAGTVLVALTRFFPLVEPGALVAGILGLLLGLGILLIGASPTIFGWALVMVFICLLGVVVLSGVI
jgi:hypothetical protein